MRALTQQPPPARSGALNVRDYGALGNGVADDCPAIQATIAAALATGVLHVHLPPGSYRLNTPLAITDTSITVSGAGQEVTRLLVNNTTGGLIFVSNGVAASAGNAHYLYVHDLTFVAVGPPATARGTALKASWPGATASPVADSLFLTLERVGVRSQDYNSDEANQPYFLEGIHIQNAQNARLSDVHVIQLNNDVGMLLWLDYTSTASAYRVTLHGLALLGGGNGLKVTGWVENVQVSDFEIVTGGVAIDIDGTTSNVKNPALLIHNGHANAPTAILRVLNWADVHVSNVSFYADLRSGSTAIGVVQCDTCRDVTFAHAKIAAVTPGTHPTDLLSIFHTARYVVTGNVFDLFHDTSGVIGNCLVVGDGATLGTIVGNVFSVNGVTATTRGILVQPNMPGTDQVSIVGNRFENLEIGVILASPSDALVANNVYLGAGLGCVGYSGTPGAKYIVQNNHPAQRTVLTLNNPTPSVAGLPDGLALANNSLATTITNFLAGYDGMRLEVIAGTPLTTVAHNTGMILAGGVPFTMSAGSVLTLRRDGSVWREVSRTVI
jgi:Pectate lyase superfamily protein